MVTLEQATGSLLQKPSDEPHALPRRDSSSYTPLHSFALDKARTYKQQYGDMYFLRLAKIKPAVEQVAAEAWDGTVVGDEPAKKVDRVLDVRQGELCWVAGTVFMDMPLKPSILEDVSKDRWLSAPVSSKKYYTDKEADQVMLEDDSGRVRLVGDRVTSLPLVTGCIIAVMGTENASGEFEVLDVKFPDLAPQPDRWALSAGKGSTTNGKATKTEQDEDADMSGTGAGAAPIRNKQIAIVSGLSFAGNDASYAIELNLLLEYLLGESLAPPAQGEVSHISRLIIAGNSISTAAASTAPESAAPADDKKKYGYDAASYNPLPSQLFDDFVAEILPTMPVTLLPGAEDPANASYPQQPIHTAMFPKARAFGPEPGQKKEGWFDAVTNPWEAEVEGWRVLGTGGQNIDDVFKYMESDDRLSMMEAMCRWRCSAPTAPDTLWSYPFQDDDPFVMNEAPHLYFVGCQDKFGTKLIGGPEGQTIRLVSVPSFAETKELVLVDTETLEVRTVKFGVA